MSISKGVLASCVALTLVLLVAIEAQAGITSIQNKTDFLTQVAGLNSLGTEDFESSTLGPDGVTGFDDPLTQGVPNGPFPAGLSPPLTIQSNTDTSGLTASLRGLDGLAALSPFAWGITSDSVFANYFADGLDLVFSPSDAVTAVGFNPLDVISPGSSLRVMAFGPAETLLTTVNVLSSLDGSTFQGFLADGGTIITRINLYGSGDAGEGVDNIMLFNGETSVIPAPAALLLVGSGLVSLAGLRRRLNI